MNIGLLAVAWIVNCYQGDIVLLDKCEQEAKVFTYITWYGNDEDSTNIPYKTSLDRLCVEMPEGCRGFEAARELGRRINNE